MYSGGAAPPRAPGPGQWLYKGLGRGETGGGDFSGRERAHTHAGLCAHLPRVSIPRAIPWPGMGFPISPPSKRGSVSPAPGSPARGVTSPATAALGGVRVPCLRGTGVGTGGVGPRRTWGSGKEHGCGFKCETRSRVHGVGTYSTRLWRAE